MSHILVVGELNGQAVSEKTLELITAARGLGSGKISVAFLDDTTPRAPGISVDTVYIVEGNALGESDSATFDAATDALTALAREIAPDVVLMSKSDSSSVVGPRIAMRLKGSYAADCNTVHSDGDQLTVTRPVYGGNANARFALSGAGPYVISVRSVSYEPDQSGGEPGEVVHFDATPHIGESRSTLIRTVQEAHEGVRLEDAEVVVSGGRGLGGPEPFQQIEELADLLGGAVGASRAACDAGWIDHSHQVGLTGKTVSPRLYLSFGISGASQHMAGCSSARNIVAVNTDPDASIFNDARFGVVGDWQKVLPALISAVRDIG